MKFGSHKTRKIRVSVIAEATMQCASEYITRISGSDAAREFLRAEYDLEYVTDPHVADVLATRLMRDPQVPTGFDFETTGWNPKGMKRPTLMGETKSVANIDAMQPDVVLQPVTFQLYRPGEPVYVLAGRLLPLFAPWLRDLALVDGSNLNFECTVMTRCGLRLPRVCRDTIHMDFLGNETTHQWQHDLKTRETEDLGVDPPRFEWNDFEIALRDDTEKALRYCSHDAWGSRYLADVAQADLESKPSRAPYANLWEHYQHRERPYTYAVHHIDQAGMPVIEAETRLLRESVTARIEEITTRAYAAIGRPVNLGSPAQLARYFHGERGYPVACTTDGHECVLCKKKVVGSDECKVHGRGAVVNTPSVDEAALKRFAAAGDAVASIIIERRGADKELGSYVEPFYMRSSDSMLGDYPWRAPGLRVHHPSFNASDVVSGRLGAPLALLVPKKGFRHQVGFPAGSGWVFFCADYSQGELRLMAELTRDPALLDAFDAGRDMHAWTGALVEAFLCYGERAVTDLSLARAVYDEIVEAKGVGEKTLKAMRDPEKATWVARMLHLLARRSQGKTLNFARLYGAGVDKIAAGLGVSNREAERIIDAVAKAYGGLTKFMDQWVEELKIDPVFLTIGGRRRVILEVQSKDPGVQAEGARLSTNQRAQCGVRDWIQGAMIQIDIDREAGGAYGKIGRGSYGHWVDGKYHLDFDVLPKTWRETPPPRLMRDLGLLGRLNAQVFNEVHDELDGAFPVEHAEVGLARVLELMEDPWGSDMVLRVPLKADGHCGRNWQICKDAG